METLVGELQLAGDMYTVRYDYEFGVTSFHNNRTKVLYMMYPGKEEEVLGKGLRKLHF